MQALVPVKHVIDYNVQIQIKAGHVVHDQVKHSINPFDEIALEECIRLKEQGIIQHITALSIGPQNVITTLRHALALGADEAIHVVCEQTTLNTLNRAEICAQLVEAHQYDLVMMGKQAIDDDASQTPQMLAGILGWPQATFASDIEPGSPNWTITREIDGGLETITIPMPAVISVDLRLNEPRFASLPNIMKAKSKPCTTRDLADFTLTATDAISIIETTPLPTRQAGQLIEDLDEFIAIIKEHCQ